MDCTRGLFCITCDAAILAYNGSLGEIFCPPMLTVSGLPPVGVPAIADPNAPVAGSAAGSVPAPPAGADDSASSSLFSALRLVL